MRDNGSDGNPTAPDSLRGFPPAPEHDEDTGLTPTFILSRKPAGRRFFDEMDRDHDGKLKLDDLKVRALERPLFMTVFGQLTNARVDHFF